VPFINCIIVTPGILLIPHRQSSLIPGESFIVVQMFGSVEDSVECLIFPCNVFRLCTGKRNTIFEISLIMKNSVNFLHSLSFMADIVNVYRWYSSWVMFYPFIANIITTVIMYNIMNVHSNTLIRN